MVPESDLSAREKLTLVRGRTPALFLDEGVRTRVTAGTQARMQGGGVGSAGRSLRKGPQGPAKAKAGRTGTVGTLQRTATVNAAARFSCNALEL